MADLKSMQDTMKNISTEQSTGAISTFAQSLSKIQQDMVKYYESLHNKLYLDEVTGTPNTITVNGEKELLENVFKIKPLHMAEVGITINAASDDVNKIVKELKVLFKPL